MPVVPLTVTAQVAVWLPSAVVAVMVVLPADRAVAWAVPLRTSTTLGTERTAGLLLDQIMVLLEALDGCTVAVKVSVLPTVSEAVV